MARTKTNPEMEISHADSKEQIVIENKDVTFEANEQHLEQKASKLNLLHIAVIPKNTQIWNSFSKRHENLSDPDSQISESRQSVVIYQPLIEYHNKNRKIVQEDPKNKPQIDYIPAQNIFETWKNVIGNSFMITERVFDNVNSKFVSLNERLAINFKNNYEIFAFVRNVKQSDITDIVREVGDRNARISEINQLCEAIVHRLQNIQIGNWEINVENILHLPFLKEEVSNEMLSEQALLSTYENILKRK